jgi:hypothetical protein
MLAVVREVVIAVGIMLMVDWDVRRMRLLAHPSTITVTTVGTHFRIQGLGAKVSG